MAQQYLLLSQQQVAVLPAEKYFQQRKDVVAPVPEGSYVESDDIEPVEQIASEAAVVYALLQVRVGGSDDSGVDVDKLVTAHPHYLLFLYDSQETGL